MGILILSPLYSVHAHYKTTTVDMHAVSKRAGKQVRLPRRIQEEKLYICIYIGEASMHRTYNNVTYLCCGRPTQPLKEGIGKYRQV